MDRRANYFRKDPPMLTHYDGYNVPFSYFADDVCYLAEQGIFYYYDDLIDFIYDHLHEEAREVVQRFRLNHHLDILDCLHDYFNQQRSIDSYIDAPRDDYSIDSCQENYYNSQEIDVNIDTTNDIPRSQDDFDSLQAYFIEEAKAWREFLKGKRPQGKRVTAEELKAWMLDFKRNGNDAQTYSKSVTEVLQSLPIEDIVKACIKPGHEEGHESCSAPSNQVSSLIENAHEELENLDGFDDEIQANELHNEYSPDSNDAENESLIDSNELKDLDDNLPRVRIIKPPASYNADDHESLDWNDEEEFYESLNDVILDDNKEIKKQTEEFECFESYDADDEDNCIDERENYQMSTEPEDVYDDKTIDDICLLFKHPEESDQIDRSQQAESKEVEDSIDKFDLDTSDDDLATDSNDEGMSITTLAPLSQHKSINSMIENQKMMPFYDFTKSADFIREAINQINTIDKNRNNDYVIYKIDKYNFPKVVHYHDGLIQRSLLLYSQSNLYNFKNCKKSDFNFCSNLKEYDLYTCSTETYAYTAIFKTAIIQNFKYKRKIISKISVPFDYFKTHEYCTKEIYVIILGMLIFKRLIFRLLWLIIINHFNNFSGEFIILTQKYLSIKSSIPKAFMSN